MPATNTNVDVKIKQDIKICMLGKRVVTIFKPYFGTRNIKTKSRCDRNRAQTTCSKEYLIDSNLAIPFINGNKEPAINMNKMLSTGLCKFCELLEEGKVAINKLSNSYCYTTGSIVKNICRMKLFASLNNYIHKIS